MAEALDENPRAIIGDNRPSLLEFYVAQNQQLLGWLTEEHADLVSGVATLKADFDAAPLIVDADEIERSLTDLGGRVSKFLKSVEAQRKIDKAPIQAAVRTVDDFFAHISAVLEPCLGSLQKRLNDYKDLKRREQIRLQEEEQRKVREAAAAAQRLRDEADKLAREQAEAAAKELAVDDSEAIAERQAQDSARRLAELEAERAAREAIAAAEEAAANRSIGTPTVRGETGAKSVQSMRWTGDIVDVDTLDLNALRPYISVAELEKAVRQYALKFKDTKPLAGARIYEKSSTSFR